MRAFNMEEFEHRPGARNIIRYEEWCEKRVKRHEMKKQRELKDE